MEVNAKLKELEEELKVLKAEIRNVLLDIREVILDKTNPLAEEHESAFIRMDLNTTAHAMAAEVAAHEAAKAADRASDHGESDLASHHDALAEEHPDEAATAGPPPGGHVVKASAEGTDAGAEPNGPGVLPDAVADPAGDQVQEEESDAEMPRVFKRSPGQPLPSTLERDEITEPTEIPPMYMAHLPPLSGNGSLSAWLTEALAAIGPQELERVIAIHRLWGALPPNISRALAYLQELLSSSAEAQPPWLKVMQDLDRLASL